MSTMYFAKLNFNSEIYKVYDDASLKGKLLNQIYQGLTEKIMHVENNEKYKFITLTKNPDDFWISGRLVLITPGINTSYDETSDDIVEELIDNKAAYVAFLFDLNKEEIAFVPKKDFGHNMFIREFKALLELAVPDMEVEIYLEKNVNMLLQRMKQLALIQQVQVHIVPPNGDKDDFDALFSTGSDEIRETWATKFGISLVAAAKTGINASSKYIRKLVAAVSKGYGKMEVIGKDVAGTRTKVTSDEDALYTKAIPDKDKDNLVEFPRYARAGIVEMLESKSTVEIATGNTGGKS
ncbi:hypothetical protein CEB3_c21280 [Peptococcaceae bacterium CEB3]|nr:hypothetical protein CEB3_c21280 [Peptococcaceae bacterium CEB3]